MPPALPHEGTQASDWLRVRRRLQRYRVNRAERLRWGVEPGYGGEDVSADPCGADSVLILLASSFVGSRWLTAVRIPNARYLPGKLTARCRARHGTGCTILAGRRGPLGCLRAPYVD